MSVKAFFSKSNLLSLQLQACEMNMESVVEAEQGCSCPFEPGLLDTDDFTEVMLPFFMEFNISGLNPFTSYCVQAVGDYGTEITGGIGSLVVTDSKSSVRMEPPSR